MPVYADAYKKIMSGKLRDYQIDADIIKPFKKGENKCLFDSIVIHPKHRDTEAILRLWNGFIYKINELESQGMVVSSVVADCVSVDGIKYMINNFKSRYICNSSGGKIYEGKFFNMAKVIPKLNGKHHKNADNFSCLSHRDTPFFC